MKEKRHGSGAPEAGTFERILNVSRLQSFSFGIFLVLIVSLVILVLLVFLLSETPFDALFYFFAGPFRNLYFFGNMVNAAVPLIFGALGIIIAVKAGSFNLGGEGQIYLSAFVTVAAALPLSQFGMIGAILAAAAGSLAAGVLSAFSGFCRAKWNTSELISTFLLSCAVIPVINFFITGPFLDPETSLLSTKKIPQSMRLTLLLEPSGLNTGLFIAFVFVLLTYFFLKKTKKGYEFRITGSNELFARYGGINTKLNTVLAMAFSGFLYGLAGSISVLGTHHAVIKEFSSGLGWSGLTVALIAGFSPGAVLPCALFIAWINAGARNAMQNTGLTYEVAVIVQAVIFFLSTSLVIKNLFLNKRNR